MKPNELSCKDLMIGDWVKIKTYGVSDKYERTEAYIYVKVAEIGSSLITVEYNNDIKEPYRICENTEIEPIPLTPEIFKKNGFDKRWHDISKCIIFDPRNDHVASICYNYHNATISIEDMPFIKVNKHNERNQKIENIGCQYVHELQHAMRLAGIEKEIIL